MFPFVLPASPNWFLPSISSGNDRGKFAFGAKNDVFIYDVDETVKGKETSSSLAKFSTFYSYHTQKLTGVCLCPDSTQNLCCSSDENEVHLWDISTKVTMQTHQNEHNDEKITCLHWCVQNTDQVLSGSEKGLIVLWRLKENRVRSFRLQKDFIYCLSSSPHNASISAFGYRSGLIIIARIDQKQQILHKLHGHRNEIFCISWSPILGDGRMDAESVLLASAGGNHIKIWNTNSGKEVVSKKVNQHAHKAESHGPTRKSWFQVHWPKSKPQYLLFSTFSGDLGIFDLHNLHSEPEFLQWNNVKKHFHLIFNIVPIGPEGNIIATFSLNRTIAFWDLSTGSAICSFTSFGGFVYSIQSSPVDPGCIGIAVGDNTLRVWRQGDKMNPFSFTLTFCGTKTVLTAVSWHPLKEGMISLGTSDGRVGYVNTNTNKQPVFFNGHHNNRTVTVVCWGPSLEKPDDNSYQIYSIGNGTLLQHKPIKQTEARESDYSHLFIEAIKEANDLKDFSGVSEMAWRYDFKIFALGFDNGVVKLYKFPSLEEVCTIQIQSKHVNCIRWHPPSVSGNGSEYWVALAGSHHHISVVDISYLYLQMEDYDKSATVTEALCKLTSHAQKTTDLSWSPHDDALLVSVGYDYEAIVWNVRKCEAIAAYRGHESRLLTCLWSSIDPDIIMSGGLDACLHLWRVSEQPKPVIVEGKKKRATKNRSNGSNPPVLAVGEAHSDLDDLQRMIEAKRIELEKNTEPKSSNESSFDRASIRHERPARDSPGNINGDDTKKLKKRLRSLFPVQGMKTNKGKESQCEDILDIAKLVHGQGSADLIDRKPHLGVFTDRLGAHRCLLQESEHHLSHDNMEYHIQLEIWRGNVAGAVQIARQKNLLSDWIVSMAPLASYELWELVCAEYADQLEDDGQYHKAVSYLLAANKVYQAIDVFRRHKLNREAVTLARVRLSANDPILEDLYTEWGQNLLKDGQFEQAAKCYLATKHIEEAGKCLTKRHDQNSMKTACQMSLISNKKELGIEYGLQYLNECLLNGEWKSGYAFLGEHSTLKALIPLISTHELLVQEMASLCPHLQFCKKPLNPENFYLLRDKEGSKSKLSLPDFLLDRTEMDQAVPWDPHLVGVHTFPHHILRTWHQKLAIAMTTHELNNVYNIMAQLHSVRQNFMDIPPLTVLISIDLTLCLLSLLLSQTSQAIQHILQAMATLYNIGSKTILQLFCKLMLPQGPKYLLKLQQEFNASRVLITMDTNDVLEEAGSQSHSSIKKYLTEMKEEEALTMNFTRCRELDCVRAFFYLAIIEYLRDTNSPDDDGVDGMPGSTGENPETVKTMEEETSVSEVSKSTESNTTVLDSNSLLSNPVDDNNSSSVDPISSETSITLKENISKLSCRKSTVLSSQRDIHKLSLPFILRLSKGVLWDVQAKREALSETLGYIHQSISTCLLRSSNKTSIKSKQENTNQNSIQNSPVLSFNQNNATSLSPSKSNHEADGGSSQNQTSNSKIPNQTNSENVCDKSVSQSDFLSFSNAFSSGQQLVPPKERQFFRSYSEIEANKFEPIPTRNSGRSISESDSRTFTDSDRSPYEIELLGSLPTSIIADSRNTKILWGDQGIGRQGGDNTCVRVSPDGTTIPVEWDDMPVDQKYSQPYVSLQLLRQEQDILSKEISRLPDVSKTPFPAWYPSVQKLLEVCVLSNQMSVTEKKDYWKQLHDWATLFALTTQQKKDTETLFSSIKSELDQQ